MSTTKFAWGMLLLFCITACYAQDAELARSLSVNGLGVAAAAPDVAVVTLGVESFAKTAEAAMADNNQRTTALLQALQTAGLAERDLQTQSINLQPRYDHRRPPNGGEAERVLLGYNASNVVTARARDLDRVGEAIDAAVKAGGNRIDGIQFEIADPTAVLKAAREAAWQNAYDKAQQLAALAGAQLGEVQKIESYEHTAGPVRQVEMMRLADSTPVQPGQQQLSVQITVVWALR